MVRRVQFPSVQMKCHCAVFSRACQNAATAVCARPVPLGFAGRIELQDMEDATLVQLDSILRHVWQAQINSPKGLL